MRRFLLLFVFVLAQSIPAVAESRERDLDRWVDRDLVPYVQEQLSYYPRFKGETVMFVVLDENAPASLTNELALSIRDRLLAAALATPGIEIGSQQGRSGGALESTPADCIHDDVHYYIGIELTKRLDNSYVVEVRALDLEDRNWVTGFGRRWHGKLSTSQRRASREQRADDSFIGSRDVPFTLAQTDLLAAHLAHQLSCTLKKRVADDYVVAIDLVELPADGLDGTVELITNNLASRQALTVSTQEDATNAILSGKAHRIDGALHQYWVTVTPSDESGDMAALSASAYVVLPNATTLPYHQTGVRPAVADTGLTTSSTVSIPNAGKDALIGSLRVSAPRSRSDCGMHSCSILQTEAHADSIVFFLVHQANFGLVRLADNECRDRTLARIARRGEALRFPITRTTTSGQRWSETHEWDLAPDLDTYYAVAVTDEKVARRIATHIDTLPLRCSEALRPGLEDHELQAWLNGLARLTASASDLVAWRAIEVRDVL